MAEITQKEILDILNNKQSYTTDQMNVALREVWNTNLSFVKDQTKSKLSSLVYTIDQKAKTMFHPVMDSMSLRYVPINHTGTASQDPFMRRAGMLTPINNPDAQERLSRLKKFDCGTYRSGYEELMSGISTQGPQVTQVNAAWNRIIDQLIISSVFADVQVKTNQSDNLTVKGINDLKKVIITNRVTVDNLIEMKTALSEIEYDDLYCVSDAPFTQSLLYSKEITSHDYAEVRALVFAKVENFAGLQFKQVASRLIPTFKYNPAEGILYSQGQMLEMTDEKRKTLIGTIRIYPVFAKNSIALVNGTNLTTAIDTSISEQNQIVMYAYGLVNGFRNSEDSCGVFMVYDTPLTNNKKEFKFSQDITTGHDNCWFPITCTTKAAAIESPITVAHEYRDMGKFDLSNLDSKGK